MLEISAALAQALRGSHISRLRVESWYDGELLVDDVPAAGGSLNVDRSMGVPESLNLTVPRLDRGVRWAPVDVRDPLAAYGQQLVVSIGVDLEHGVTEWLQLGWFLVDNARADGDTVTVRANGLLQLVEEADFVAPFQPTGTLVSTVRALVEPALTVEFTGLADRAVPEGMQWDKDRLGALHEVLDSWPAVATVTPDGDLLVAPPPDEPGTIVWDLNDDSDGTVVDWQGASGRDGLFNVVVARGEDANGEPVQGVVYDIAGASPIRVQGPFNPLAVPYEFFSPLLTTVDQCRAAAQTILERKRRTQARKLEVSTVPQYALQVADTTTVTGEEVGLAGALAVIDSYSLPLTPGGGAMGLSLRVHDG